MLEGYNGFVSFRCVIGEEGYFAVGGRENAWPIKSLIISTVTNRYALGEIAGATHLLLS